jgi:hypothetical protein
MTKKTDPTQEQVQYLISNHGLLSRHQIMNNCGITVAWINKLQKQYNLNTPFKWSREVKPFNEIKVPISGYVPRKYYNEAQKDFKELLKKYN